MNTVQYTALYTELYTVQQTLKIREVQIAKHAELRPLNQSIIGYLTKENTNATKKRLARYIFPPRLPWSLKDSLLNSK